MFGFGMHGPWGMGFGPNGMFAGPGVPPPPPFIGGPVFMDGLRRRRCGCGCLGCLPLLLLLPVIGVIFLMMLIF